MKLTKIEGVCEGRPWSIDLGSLCHITVIAGRMLVVKPDGSMYFVDSDGRTEETHLMAQIHRDDGI